MKKKTDLVTKSNRLIEASYRLTLTEQQIILYCIAKIGDSNADFSALDSITISAMEFASVFSSGKDAVYYQLQEAAKSLFDRRVSIRQIDVETGKLAIIDTRWISEKAQIDEAGVIKIIFAPRIVDFIKNLDREFTPFTLDKISKMTSVHAIRLYELLRQYRSIGERTIQVIELKNMLELSDEYDRFFDFEKRVITPSYKQINDHSDILVKYSKIKNGNKVEGVHFKIEKNEINKTEEKTKKKIVKKENDLLKDNKKEEKSENKTYEDFHAEIIERERKRREKKG